MLIARDGDPARGRPQRDLSDPSHMEERLPSAETSATPLEHKPGRSNVGFLVGALAIVGAIVWLTFSSFDEQIYFYTVDEATAEFDRIEGREVRIKGNVVVDSHRMQSGVLTDHLFAITAGGATVEVSYTGALPDTFDDDVEVTALGKLVAIDRFEAVEIVAQCPSRYEQAPPTSTTASR